ncbi:hypothetical protein V2J09_021633 [Rumex salicifolius]
MNSASQLIERDRGRKEAITMKWVYNEFRYPWLNNGAISCYKFEWEPVLFKGIGFGSKSECKLLEYDES